eukprot:TRINITY_DN107861_c0_g1_i1.p1 TRINITY_DN107861_c0_g1~~TRINITY_DN107861_c0_g1_i1.p1  ORF type:complete len:585 (-),score=64.48 TRINITY_DN107861_c0_g1_i1:114-1868(-)
MYLEELVRDTFSYGRVAAKHITQDYGCDDVTEEDEHAAKQAFLEDSVQQSMHVIFSTIILQVALTMCQSLSGLTKPAWHMWNTIELLAAGASLTACGTGVRDPSMIQVLLTVPLVFSITSATLDCVVGEYQLEEPSCQGHGSRSPGAYTGLFLLLFKAFLHLSFGTPSRRARLVATLLFGAHFPISFLAAYHNRAKFHAMADQELCPHLSSRAENGEMLQHWSVAGITSTLLLVLVLRLRWHIDSWKLHMLTILESQRRSLVEYRKLGCRAHNNTGQGKSLKAPSVQLQSALPEALPEACRGPHGDADCVPANYNVCVEGKELPLEIGVVEAGQRILCLDSMSTVPKYVQVLSNSVENAAEEDNWVAISLADGSKLVVSEEHPIRVTAGGSLPECVRSKDVIASHHEVSSLEVKQLPVLEVRRMKASDAAVFQRASLRVAHPERFNVLVKAPECSSFKYQAVGSIDASPVTCEVDRCSMVFGSGMLQESLRRTDSAPASLGLSPSGQTARPNPNKGRRLQDVKSSALYRDLQKLWSENGRSDSDPVTPRRNQSRRQFQKDVNDWVLALKQKHNSLVPKSLHYPL